MSSFPLPSRLAGLAVQHGHACISRHVVMHAGQHPEQSRSWAAAGTREHLAERNVLCREEGREALAGGWMAVLPVSYALFSGLLGTQSVVFCKSLSSLLRTTLAGDSQLTSAFFWVLMALFVATATFWVTRLNKVHPWRGHVSAYLLAGQSPQAVLPLPCASCGLG